MKLIEKADYEEIMEKYIDGKIPGEKVLFVLIGIVKNKQDEIIDAINQVKS